MKSTPENVVPRRRNGLDHGQRLVAVLDQADSPLAIVDERGRDRRDADLVVIDVDQRPGRIAADGHPPLDAPGGRRDDSRGHRRKPNPAARWNLQTGFAADAGMEETPGGDKISRRKYSEWPALSPDRFWLGNTPIWWLYTTAIHHSLANRQARRRLFGLAGTAPASAKIIPCSARSMRVVERLPPSLRPAVPHHGH